MGRGDLSLVRDVEPNRMRDVMGQFATGVTVITTGDGHPHGMTANAFTSVSLDPPMVLVCVQHDSRMTGAVRDTGRFGVSILDEEQASVAGWFAKRTRPEGTDEFRGLPTYPAPVTGAPLFENAMAWLECSVVEFVEAGDHVVLLSEVLSCELGPGREPLVFFNGEFPTTCKHEDCLPERRSA